MTLPVCVFAESQLQDRVPVRVPQILTGSVFQLKVPDWIEHQSRTLMAV